LQAAQPERTIDTPGDSLETIPQAIGLFVGIKPQPFAVSPPNGFASLAMVLVQTHNAHLRTAAEKSRLGGKP
jgi:hypothetical protein